MRTSESRGFRTVLLLCGVASVAGVILLTVGHRLPVYTVPFDVAQKAWDSWCGADSRRVAENGEPYLASFGWHYALMNAGMWIITTAGSVGGLAVLLHRTAGPCTPWLRTPAGHWTFIAMGSGAMIGFLPGIIHGLSTDLNRRYFPSCADSIGIPIFGTALAIMILTPVLILFGLLITRRFGTLPVPLSQWDVARPVRSWSVTLLLGAAMAVFALLGVMGITSSDIVSPSMVAILYLLAATRAALLAPKVEAQV